MSYDLMVFDPQAPPKDREAFLTWYGEQTKWSGGHKYDDPGTTTLALRAWFMDMIRTFPAMNGPYKSDDVDADEISDYSIGRSVIYVGFSWSAAETAYDATFRMAEKHGVGFFDVSADNGGVWVPGPGGRLICLHGDAGQHQVESTPAAKKWWRFWK